MVGDPSVLVEEEIQKGPQNESLARYARPTLGVLESQGQCALGMMFVCQDTLLLYLILSLPKAFPLLLWLTRGIMALKRFGIAYFLELSL